MISHVIIKLIFITINQPTHRNSYNMQQEVKKYSLSLKTYLILTVSIITCVVCTLMIVIYSHSVKTNSISDMGDYGETLTKDISYIVIDYLISEDFGALDDFVMEFSTRQNVKSITITNNNGVILADTHKQHMGEKF